MSCDPGKFGRNCSLSCHCNGTDVCDNGDCPNDCDPQWTGPTCQLRLGKIITIHHECPCRIGKSQLRGRNFYQGRGLLMMDYFLPLLVNFKPQIRFSI